MILLILARAARRAFGLARGHVTDGGGAWALDPSGLSVPGWAHDPENPQEDRLVVDGTVRSAGRLTAVVTALDTVVPFDLPDVRTEDRVFVASEMTAFLRSWLQALACPVLDRPTTLALSGAAGDRAVWSKAAAAVGVADRQAAPSRQRGVTPSRSSLAGSWGRRQSLPPRQPCRWLTPPT